MALGYVPAATETDPQKIARSVRNLHENAFSKHGTTTNDNAAAGDIGEYLSATLTYANRITLSNGVPANITSLSLTAGDWDVVATGYIETTGSPTGNAFNQVSISQTSATMDQGEGNFMYMPIFSAAGDIANVVGPVRKSFASTTTVYMVVDSAFTGGTFTAWGIIRARRIR